MVEKRSERWLRSWGIVGILLWSFAVDVTGNEVIAPWAQTEVMVRPLAELFKQRNDGYRLFRPLEQPLVLVLQFPNLTRQSAAMNRIAALVEKRDAPNHRVLDDQELLALVTAGGKRAETFFLGHDYRAQDLARFFTLAKQDRVALNQEERTLFALLQYHSFFVVLAENSWGAANPEKVLVTIPASGKGSGKLDLESWWFTLRHELSHGEFFTNARYRSYCEQAWAKLDDKVQKVFEEEFANFRYDVTNQELLVNEWQAFLWEPWVGGFIDVRLRRLGESLESLRHRFLYGIDTATEPITYFFENRAFRNLPAFDQQGRLKIDDEKQISRERNRWR